MNRFDLELPELEVYRPELKEPSDFDQFWSTTLSESPFDPAAMTREPASGPLVGVNVYDVTYPGFQGEPIKAWFLTPAGATGPLPTVVEYIGYGGGRGFPFEWLRWPNCGYTLLVMDTRGQGSWGNGGGTADPHGSAPAVPGMLTKGIEDPQDYYYRRTYVDAHHGVEAAATMPEVDAERIAVFGGSQGGGLAIAAASLNQRVRAALIDFPFLCHFPRSVGMTGSAPYSEIVDYLKVFRGREEQVFRTLSYFDGVLLGKRAKAPAYFSLALMDDVCPPSTVFAARNWWGANAAQPPHADYEVYPFNGHEGGGGYHWLKQVDWLGQALSL